MKKLLVTLLVFCAYTGLYAQDDQTSEAIVASEFHVTRPLSEIFAENPVDETNLYEEGTESSDRQHRVPTQFEFTAEDGAEYGNDEKYSQTEMGRIDAGQTRANWAGQTASGFRPYDPSGAVGPNHYV
ncbi:MAG: hypothetical protein ACKVOK_10275, partial [Flavobacteriales bacterium]